ncbi:hypothetical protein [Marinilabilia rubra]|uniref:DUF5683 domain-containing protein n=1 Tax=Marinilabilia rubra TaxID=2162893 RepID=A0A2U2B7W2_9BACT|nr:hypothetical protein [Marinilabilia rubra]PWD99134.1 hypothetical protein DDZ16_11060 [Marinilabilia rubra]
MLKSKFLCIFFASFSLVAQSQSISKRIQFANYLVNKDFHEEGVFECKNILKELKLNQIQKDSVFYLKGWAEYNLKHLKESSFSFQKVSFQSTFYPKSILFGSYNLIHLGKYENATQVLNNFRPQNKINQHFINYLFAGIDLLQRDLPSFRKTVSLLPPDYYGFEKELKHLKILANRLETQKEKSPVFAGILSGIVPGSGQIYSGKTGQGIAALLMSTGLALVTIENYEKQGPEKFKTIFFGSVFSVFYIGNIYGAVFSAKIANNERHALINKQVLFDLHIPLRNVFD